jgi:rare lipoprotein A
LKIFTAYILAALLGLLVAMEVPAEARQPRNARCNPGVTQCDAVLASWYGPEFRGRRTANGERFNPKAMTAAHPSLPFQTKLKVTNPKNGRTVTVRVNDRGPGYGRAIDLSEEAARELGIHEIGVAPVEIQVAQNE